MYTWHLFVYSSPSSWTKAPDHPYKSFCMYVCVCGLLLLIIYYYLIIISTILTLFFYFTFWALGKRCKKNSSFNFFFSLDFNYLLMEPCSCYMHIYHLLHLGIKNRRVFEALIKALRIFLKFSLCFFFFFFCSVLLSSKLDNFYAYFGSNWCQFTLALILQRSLMIFCVSYATKSVIFDIILSFYIFFLAKRFFFKFKWLLHLQMLLSAYFECRV